MPALTQASSASTNLSCESGPQPQRSAPGVQAQRARRIRPHMLDDLFTGAEPRHSALGLSSAGRSARSSGLPSAWTTVRGVSWLRRARSRRPWLRPRQAAFGRAGRESPGVDTQGAGLTAVASLPPAVLRTAGILETAMTRSETYAVDAAARPFYVRLDEAFPALTDTQIARIRRFGTARRFADGELLFEAGKRRSGMFIVLSGHVALTARDGLGRITPVVDQGPGQFIAELGTLADGGVSLTDGRAEGEVEALLIPPESLRTLMVEQAELGERIMRALILRRVALIEFEAAGPLLIGAAASRDVVRLENFLRRNGHPHRLLDPAVDPAAADIVARLSPAPSELPLVICPSADILRNPSEAALAHCLGLLGDRFGRSAYDLAIVGCGPAGLSAAVYAASDGLAVVVLDAHEHNDREPVRRRIHGRREPCRSASDDRQVVRRSTEPISQEPETVRQRGLARVPQDVSARADHQRQLGRRRREARHDVRGRRVYGRIEQAVGMSVATKEILEAHHVARRRSPDQQRACRLELDQRDPAED